MAQKQQAAVDSKKVVTDGLNVTRKNLLDLSGRNRLLNFKHTGAKVLRFVDELPNHIYAELVASAESEQKKGFLISPVPLPKKSEYPDIADAKDLKKIDAKAHARKLGINTDFEMAAATTSVEERHQDDKLQTLHFPEDLDRIVRRIQSEARTAIEESGVNMLFLCLGFLKWTDHDDSQVFNYAPLIMIPIEIERDKVDARTGFAKFRLKYTGEDILDNICLRVKLSQLAIELPSFEEFDDPESYFSALAEKLADIKPDWAIHRFMTIGFLSFGKMLMYLDLDPAKWPGEEGIADAAHILDIFAGNHSGGDSIASEFDIDGDKKLQHIAQVMDADSSQHSAIIDVLNGKNLVIEGPPGTGKSQTITNLIAACLEQGKTVLFVAEKLAALQVVRKRLDSVGLGDFCLELHSHKTQKKVMLADLKKRLELNTDSYRSAANTAETRLQELNQKKAKLIEYAKAINAPFGNVEQSPHQIFWKSEVLQKELSQPYKAENFVTLRDVAKLTLVVLRTHMDSVQNLADNLRAYFGGDARRKNHYWHGLNLVGPVEYGQQQDIFLALQALHSAAKIAAAAFDKLQTLGLDNSLKTYKLERLEESDFTHARFFALLDIPGAQTAIDSCLSTLQDYQKHLENYLNGLTKYELKPEQLDALDAPVVKEVKLPVNATFAEIRTMCDTLNSAIDAFTKTQPLFKEAAAYVGLNDDMDLLPALQAILKVATLCTAVDKNELALRNPAIENAMSNGVIKELPSKVTALRQQRAQLDEAFHLNALPSHERLAEIATALHNKKLFSGLSSPWRAARNDYRKAAKNDAAKNCAAAAAKVDALIAYLKDMDNFSQSAAYVTLLPGIFKGIDTDIESLQTAIAFYEKLHAELLPIPTFGTRLYNCLRSLEPHLYEWFSQNRNTLAEGIQGFNAAVSILALIDNDKQDGSIKVLIERVHGFAGEYKKLEPSLSAAAIAPTLSLAQVREMLVEAKAAATAKAQFLADKTTQACRFSDERENLTEQIEILQSLSNTVAKVNKILPASAAAHILCADGFQTLQVIKELLGEIHGYQEALRALSGALPLSKTLAEFWSYAGSDDKALLDAIIAKLDTLEAEREAFDKWCEVLNGYAEIKSLGLDGMVTSFANAADLQVPFSDYVPLYHYLVYHTLSHEVLRQNKVLGSFARVTHENIRASFKEIDLELQKLNARKLARDISRRSIPEGSGGRSPKEFTDARLIRHEIGKQTKHVPIRQLVNRAYDALVAIKPCFMMGPLSVAQYIPPHHEKFDILIMDEASQVKPEDAIGVLARAKQVVVVGDSNQLPPTGFFDTLGGDSDSEDETTIENSESILDVCKPLFQPIRRLRWHYRSQHQSLISFSNSHFYDDDLIIFPSPTAHSDIAGVKHVYVADGIYTSQSNPIEAKRVVEEVMQMIEQRPDLSYGIVTLNAKQKMVIEDEIERVRKDNSVFDNYVSESELTDEEFFVKNLETVQGDERDVIFISTTFGLDEEGTFRQHFGPINGKDGWRRLNVLFTRAKQHVRIFSSFQPERIKVDDTKEQRGLRALKDYLNYAITGVDNHSYLTGQEPDSDFERAVGAYLKNKGYDVVYQLGVAGYRIDMVVRHPQCPTDYIIAIECDGATYHSARTARDRDRLREDNLRKLGWSHIHRIWSSDWFKRRDQEEARLLQAVESAIRAKTLAA